MSLLIKSPLRLFVSEFYSSEIQKCLRVTVRRQSTNAQFERKENRKAEGEFRVLKIVPQRERFNRKQRLQLQPVKYKGRDIPLGKNWMSYWPGPRSFHPATVPLPVRMGFVKNRVPSGKFANLELMKIPNFLHLTPPAIEKHCEALKKFCTKWPQELDNDEIEKAFPINITTSDYCHSSPTIRDPDARIISLQVKLHALELNEHAKDKLLRLVGPRYNPKTDILTITTDSCPLKKQNYDYAYYLLTALYHEAWKREDWENEKGIEDMEKYIWSERESSQKVMANFEYNDRPVPDTTRFAKAVEDILNEGETDQRWDEYKEAAVELLGLPPFKSSAAT